MNKYKLTVHFIGHKLSDEDLKDAFECVNEYTKTPYRVDYSQSGGDGFIEVTTNLIQTGKDLKLEVVYCGEGETFKERVADMKNLVETRELQNTLLYDMPSDISDRIASRITATIDQIG